jgi:hypothetical protein
VAEIDKETRDRLIAHARQDAAHAVLNTVAIMQDVLALKADLRNFVRSMVVGLVGCFALLGFMCGGSAGSDAANRAGFLGGKREV